MATSNAFSTDNEYIKYTVSVIQNSQNITKNISSVTVKVNFYRTNTGYETYGSGTVYCKIDGVTYTAPVTASQKITSSGIDLFNRTLNITHKSNGAKTLTVSAWISHSRVSSSEQSYTQALTTIPRATTPVLSNSNVYMGNNVTITMGRASNSFTHTLTYEMGKASGTIGTALETSATWTIPLSLASQIPNAKSGTVTLTCKTYQGTTLIGTKSVAFIATVPQADVKPTITGVSISENDKTVAAGNFGAFVQHKSKLNVSANATGQYGATIAKIKITVDGTVYNYNAVTDAPVYNGGTRSVKVEVTDSRGITNTRTDSISVLAYSKPKISGFVAYRSDIDGSTNYEGEYATTSAKFTVSSLNGLNTKSYSIEYKEKSATVWTAIVTGSVYNYDGTNTSSIAILNPDNSYNLRLVVSDYFGSTTAEVEIPTAFTLVDYRSTGKGIAFGKVSEQDAMEIALDVVLTGTLLQEEKQTPTLLNSWVNYGGEYENAGYWKDKNGVVHLHGVIKDGITTFNTFIFQLPTKYRPEKREIFVAPSGSSGMCQIYILPSGNVSLGNGADTTYISLSGITFKAGS